MIYRKYKADGFRSVRCYLKGGKSIQIVEYFKIV